MARLVLSRKLNEKVVLHSDDGILATVKISRIDRNQVRITFEAVPTLKIDRHEVYEDHERRSKNS